MIEEIHVIVAQPTHYICSKCFTEVDMMSGTHCLLPYQCKEPLQVVPVIDISRARIGRVTIDTGRL